MFSKWNKFSCHFNAWWKFGTMFFLGTGEKVK